MPHFDKVKGAVDLKKKKKITVREGVDCNCINNYFIRRMTSS